MLRHRRQSPRGRALDKRWPAEPKTLEITEVKYRYSIIAKNLFDYQLVIEILL
jgi:hypothetical protein